MIKQGGYCRPELDVDNRKKMEKRHAEKYIGKRLSRQLLIIPNASPTKGVRWG